MRSGTSVLAGLGLMCIATGCMNTRESTNSDAYFFQVMHKEKVEKNFHLKESQKTIENNSKKKSQINRKNEKFKKKQQKYLVKLNEYNRYKAQNKEVGAFQFY